MNILVINCGSSSVKYQLINMETETVLAKGLAERIGIPDSVLNHQVNNRDKIVIKRDMKNHKEAISLILDMLVDKEHGVISDMSEISAVGHRVVHGGEKFSGSVIIDDEVMKVLEECSDLAPLHNPPNIMGIEACKQLMPNIPMVGVFDTAFHQTMPRWAYLYPIPYELYVKYGIRKYGFHGTSHKYVAMKAAALLNRPLEELRIITCHLGNGASLTAVKYGKSVDTSMGFTPLEGIAMGTRSGSIDPAIISFIMAKENISVEKVMDMLNKKSGVLGLSGISNDFRDIQKAAEEGNERAKIALEVFNYRVRKFIGSYTAAMGGVDAIVFTAGLGENSPETRENICRELAYLGVKIDPEKNQVRGKEMDVSTDDAKVRVLVIPTNEELMIARETVEVLNKR